VAVSVTVPLPQSEYRFDLSPHGPAPLNKTTAGAGSGPADLIDAKVGPPDVMKLVANPSSSAMKIPKHDLSKTRFSFPIRSPIRLS
jgi:hypothetical protein